LNTTAAKLEQIRRFEPLEHTGLDLDELVTEEQREKSIVE
jgi:hypothetical protein